MEAVTETAPVSRKGRWAGAILSGLVVLFMAFDGVIKLMKLAFVLDATTRLGIPGDLAVPIGILGLTCTVLYAIPRTSVLGAILLTGYLGGATAFHVRVGDPLFSHVLFPSYVGLMAWGGLYLREEWLRALLPLRS